ncbi:MAG: ferritin [Spirochaetales bacterium]|nr:ferritin [Spirochaetales bacterium]
MNEKMLNALNEQINEELNSMYIYMAMAADLDEMGFGGMAHWMRKQAQEEQVHAFKFQGYVKDRQGRVVFKAIPEPQTTWESPLEIFKAALAHEEYITGTIHKLVKLARELDDIATEVFLNYFVTEQVEEEDSAHEVVDALEKVGDSVGPLYQIDSWLRKRD